MKDATRRRTPAGIDGFARGQSIASVGRILIRQPGPQDHLKKATHRRPIIQNLLPTAQLSGEKGERKPPSPLLLYLLRHCVELQPIHLLGQAVVSGTNNGPLNVPLPRS